MDKSTLIRLFGPAAAFLHGDTLLLDRWLWLRRFLPHTADGETLIDVGCGSGAFSINAAKRGYRSLGLSWDERNQADARIRAGICKAEAAFDVLDVRHLHELHGKAGPFDVALCLEVIEHILDDRKLVADMAELLKPGGYLFLTTPNRRYAPMSDEDKGPFAPIENGAHVRRGYTPAMLRELCATAGLLCEEISYCSGFFSQKTTALMRRLGRVSFALGWLAVLPLRPLAVVLDLATQAWAGYPPYSICLVAMKPRFPEHAQHARHPQAAEAL